LSAQNAAAEQRGEDGKDSPDAVCHFSIVGGRGNNTEDNPTDGRMRAVGGLFLAMSGKGAKARTDNCFHHRQGALTGIRGVGMHPSVPVFALPPFLRHR
jgi:hypothetical protein